jgi:hypothetical protein
MFSLRQMLTIHVLCRNTYCWTLHSGVTPGELLCFSRVTVTTVVQSAIDYILTGVNITLQTVHRQAVVATTQAVVASHVMQ